MIFKTLAGIALSAAAGAAVGYSQILCPDGSCPLTGSAYGGAIFGGILGYALMSAINTPIGSAGTTQEPPSDFDPHQR